MSPCCVAAAAAAPAATALAALALTALVLATDVFGLALLLATGLALAVHHLRWAAADPRLLNALGGLLVARAAWLLATTRRPLVLAVWRSVLPRAGRAVRHLSCSGVSRRLVPGGSRPAGRRPAPPAVYAIGPVTGGGGARVVTGTAGEVVPRAEAATEAEA